MVVDPSRGVGQDEGGLTSPVLLGLVFDRPRSPLGPCLCRLAKEEMARRVVRNIERDELQLVGSLAKAKTFP